MPALHHLQQTKDSVIISGKFTAFVTLPQVHGSVYVKTVRKAKHSVLHFCSTCLTSALFTMDQPISLRLVFWSCHFRISTATNFDFDNVICSPRQRRVLKTSRGIKLNTERGW